MLRRRGMGGGRRYVVYTFHFVFVCGLCVVRELIGFFGFFGVCLD